MATTVRPIIRFATTRIRRASASVTHPSAAPGRSSADDLVARPDESPVHLRSAAQRRHLPDQSRPADRRAGADVLIKLDPNYNCQWPRAVVPYKRIYGIDRAEEVAGRWPTTAGCRRSFRKGRPIGLVGTSSLYKRESFPRGGVPKGSVTARWMGDKNDFSFRLGYNGLEVFNSSDEGNAELAQPRRRRRPLRQRRNPCHPHPGDGADHRSQSRTEVGPAVLQLRQGAAAHPGRDSRAEIRRGRQTAARSRRQSRHQLRRQNPGRHAVHVPTVEQGRNGSGDGADVASGSARRSAHELRRLPRPFASADAVRKNRGRAGRAIKRSISRARRPCSRRNRPINRIGNGMLRSKPACATSRR